LNLWNGGFELLIIVIVFVAVAVAALFLFLDHQLDRTASDPGPRSSGRIAAGSEIVRSGVKN
jgi:hypothetical protein